MQSLEMVDSDLCHQLASLLKETTFSSPVRHLYYFFFFCNMDMTGPEDEEDVLLGNGFVSCSIAGYEIVLFFFFFFFLISKPLPLTLRFPHNAICIDIMHSVSSTLALLRRAKVLLILVPMGMLFHWQQIATTVFVLSFSEAVESQELC